MDPVLHGAFTAVRPTIGLIKWVKAKFVSPLYRATWRSVSVTTDGKIEEFLSFYVAGEKGAELIKLINFQDSSTRHNLCAQGDSPCSLETEYIGQWIAPRTPITLKLSIISSNDTYLLIRDETAAHYLQHVSLERNAPAEAIRVSELFTSFNKAFQALCMRSGVLQGWHMRLLEHGAEIFWYRHRVGKPSRVNWRTWFGVFL